MQVSGSITTFPSSAAIVSEPLGVALVISAWNFPFCKLSNVQAHSGFTAFMARLEEPKIQLSEARTCCPPYWFNVCLMHFSILYVKKRGFQCTLPCVFWIMCALVMRVQTFQLIDISQPKCNRYILVLSSSMWSKVTFFIAVLLCGYIGATNYSVPSQ